MNTITLPTKKVTKAAKVNGYVLFEGPSKIDGSNIVGIITLKTSNAKTGQMAQLWILNADLNPVQASKEGKDSSVCGECKLRRSLGGACYVNLGQGPLAVYNSYKKGNYPKLDNYTALKGYKIRFGAYGDPFALPSDILDKLSNVAVNNTSYSHQWRQGDDILKAVSMASVDSIQEQLEAAQKGWRTFRVSKVENHTVQLLDDEIICPNVTKGISCADCGLCGGTNKTAKNIVVPVHGSLKNRF